MKYILTLICFVQLNSYAQIGGLLNKAKDLTKKDSKKDSETKDEKLDYSSNFYAQYSERISSALSKNQQIKYRIEKLQAVNVDTLKNSLLYYENNKKKFSGDAAIYAEALKEDVTNFDKDFDEFVLPDINSFIGKKNDIYALDFYTQSANYIELINVSKKMYKGPNDLNGVVNKIETAKKECAAKLVADGKITCAEQLEHLWEFRFSSGDDGCLKGTVNEIIKNSIDNGVYVYLSTENLVRGYSMNSIRLNIYIDDEKISSINIDKDYYSETKNGWIRTLLIPGLKNFDKRSSYPSQLAGYKKLKKNCKITVKSESKETWQASFNYDISAYSGTVDEYFNKIEMEYYKTVKFPTNKFKDATLEKAALDYYNDAWTKYNKVKGKAYKVVIEGNNWTQKRSKVGVLTGRYTTAYFAVKGDDGNCYFFDVRIDQAYIDNGKYENKISFGSFPSEERILCENVK